MTNLLKLFPVSTAIYEYIWGYGLNIYEANQQQIGTNDGAQQISLGLVVALHHCQGMMVKLWELLSTWFRILGSNPTFKHWWMKSSECI